MSEDHFSDFEESPQTLRPVGPSMIIGVLIVVVGAVLLAERFGLIDPQAIFRFWPLLLVGVGVAKVVGSRSSGGWLSGAMAVLFGAAIFLNNEGYVRLDWSLVWPAGLIAAGVLLMVRALQARREVPASTATVRGFALFGGGGVKNAATDFRGGSVFAMFGGYEVDLTRASLQQDEVELFASAIFGGVEIHVPPDWTVINKGIPLFGGYVDERVLAPNQEPRADRRLIVSGMALFGGVEINSKGAVRHE